MAILWFLLIGLCAGWLARQLVKSGSSGLLTDMIVGVIGALVGGFLVQQLGFAPVSLLGSLITATLGAAALLL